MDASISVSTMKMGVHIGSVSIHLQKLHLIWLYVLDLVFARTLKMSIISSEIVEDSVQGSGDRYIRFRYEFDNGDIIEINRGQQPSSYDADVGLVDGAIEAQQIAINREDANLASKVIGGLIDVMGVIPYHPSTESDADKRKRFAKKLLRKIATEQDLKIVRRAFYPVWYWLKFNSGYNPSQIASYLDITVTTLSRIDARFQALHDHLQLIDDDESYLGEVDD